jgi:hypothetical protein
MKTSNDTIGNRARYLLVCSAVPQPLCHCVPQKEHTVKLKFTLEQAMKTQRESRGIVYSYFNLSARWGWMVNTMPWPIYPRERDPVSISMLFHYLFLVTHPCKMPGHILHKAKTRRIRGQAAIETARSIGNSNINGNLWWACKMWFCLKVCRTWADLGRV